MPSHTDEKLVSDYLAGDEESLEIIIKHYLKPIYGFVFRYAGNQADAEDIAQNVFVKMWRQLKKFDTKKNFKVWLFTIAKNTALDFLKKKKAVPFSAFEDKEGNNFLANTLADPAPLPQEIFERQELGQLLNSAIKKLPLAYQEVLSLHYQNQLTFQEIAEILSEPLNTVKSRHHRGVIMLRDFLEDAPKLALKSY